MTHIYELIKQQQEVLLFLAGITAVIGLLLILVYYIEKGKIAEAFGKAYFDAFVNEKEHRKAFEEIISTHGLLQCSVCGRIIGRKEFVTSRTMLHIPHIRIIAYNGKPVHKACLGKAQQQKTGKLFKALAEIQKGDHND